MTVPIVELALPDGPLVSYELDDPYVTKIGGKPCWNVSETELKKAGVSTDVLKCQACGAQLYLVLQMDCPWPGEEGRFDRVMYVFGCNSRLCTEQQGTKAWKAFVLQVPKTATEPVAKPASKGLWDVIMSEPVATPSTGAVEQAVKQMSLEDATFYDEAYPVEFPAIKLHICEEMIQEKSTGNKKSLAEEEQIPEAFSVKLCEEDWGQEAYESSHPMGVDKAFLTFTKRTSSYPRQCVRFSPTSAPLLFCQETIPDVGCCSRCGQRRMFEAQLMPAVLSLLPTNGDKYLGHVAKRNSHPLFGDGMEWGTVMLFTCGTCTRSTATPLLIEATTFTQIERI